MIGLQKILINNPHQHPLIYLKGIKYESLKLILRFMYLGETKVSEEDLQSFLTAAEELKVKIIDRFIISTFFSALSQAHDSSN